MLTYVYGQTQNKLALFLISANYILESKAVPRSLALTTVNGAVILVGGFSVKRRKSVVCSISYVSLSYIFRKHVTRNFWNCLSPDFSGTKNNSYSFNMDSN